MVDAHSIIRRIPFGIEDDMGRRHGGSDVNGIAFAQLVLIPTTERESFLACRGIRIGQNRQCPDYLLILAGLRRVCKFYTTVVKSDIVAVTIVFQSDSTVIAKFFRMIKSTGIQGNSTESRIAF